MKILLLSMLSSLTSVWSPKDNPNTKWMEVPTIAINFHMMGDSRLDNEHVSSIHENVAYINQEFEGQLQFEVGIISAEQASAYLPDLHIDALTIGEKKIKSLVEPIEQSGSVNVFVFETYVPEGGVNALMGFTPILSEQYDAYEPSSPQFDRIFIAYEALGKKTTMVHELGHFFGLDHPWEMSNLSRLKIGLRDSNPNHNHMTYNKKVNHFTDEQLDHMREFALSYRSYLIEDIKLVAYN